MTDKLPEFGPGSMACHEALHMCLFLANAVDEQLCVHESIRQNPEWLALAAKASEALADLHQTIAMQRHTARRDQAT